MADPWQITPDADDAAVYAVLARDRLWNCFAIADLAPPMRQFCRFALAQRAADGAVAACLILQHPAFAVISPFGDPAGVAAILTAVPLPPQVQVQSLPDHLPMIVQHYRFTDGPRAILRMALAPDVQLLSSEQSPGALIDSINRPSSEEEPLRAGASLVRLGPADAAALHDLYAEFPTNHFRDDQLDDGIFFGVREGEALLAAGGTHVMAPTYAMGVIGSIYTRPAARGRGYASAITAAVATALRAQGCHDVVLNVFADNDPAIRVYTRLGFRLHADYRVGMADRLVQT
jgi:GNAT superfamily N-acetyltransferase